MKLEWEDDAYQRGYERGRQDASREGFDLHSIRDTNPVVNFLWWIRVIQTAICVIIGIGLLIYFAYAALSMGGIKSLFRGVF